MEFLKKRLSGNYVGLIKYAKNTTWLLTEKFFRIINSVVLGILIARYLGPDEFGIFNYAQSLVGLFIAIAGFGLDEIVIRELLKKVIKSSKIMGSAFVMKLGGALIMLGSLSAFLIYSQKTPYEIGIVLIIASSALIRSFNVIDFFFQSTIAGKHIAKANILGLVLASLLKIVFLIFSAPLIAFAYLIPLESLAAISLMIIFYSKYGDIKNWQVDWRTIRKLLSYSWPLLLSGIFSTVNMKIDQIMLKEMVSSSAVGVYAAAARISEGWFFIPVILAASLFPAILKAKASSYDLYYSRLQALYSLMLWMSVIVGLFFTFFGADIVILLLGASYQESGEILVVHIWSGVNVAIGIVWTKWIITEGKQRITIYVQFLAAILNVGSNLFLIPRFGSFGAALSTMLSYFISSFVSFFLFKPMTTFSLIIKAFNPLSIFKYSQTSNS